MEIRYLETPELSEPIMIAAWPGMGYLAKISADYLRKRLKAKLFAEIIYYQNAIIYKKSLAELPEIKHRFYSVTEHDLIICVGDAQPSIPEETYKLAECVVKLAERFNVKRIYTMAAFPNDYLEKPKVYGVYTNDRIKSTLVEKNILLFEEEGVINGLNGILIGVAKNRKIEGICLLGEIRYANVPQHMTSKVVLEKLTALLEIEIDTSQLEHRAKRVEASIRSQLSQQYTAEKTNRKEEKEFNYIS